MPPKVLNLYRYQENSLSDLGGENPKCRRIFAANSAEMMFKKTASVKARFKDVDTLITQRVAYRIKLKKKSKKKKFLAESFDGIHHKQSR